MGLPGRWHTQTSHASATPFPSYLALCVTSTWLFLGCILYNKPVIVKCFPEFWGSF